MLWRQPGLCRHRKKSPMPLSRTSSPVCGTSDNSQRDKPHTSLMALFETREVPDDFATESERDWDSDEDIDEDGHGSVGDL